MKEPLLLHKIQIFQQLSDLGHGKSLRNGRQMTFDLSLVKGRQHIERKEWGTEFVFSCFDLRLFPKNSSEENEKMFIPDNSLFFEDL